MYTLGDLVRLKNGSESEDSDCGRDGSRRCAPHDRERLLTKHRALVSAACARTENSRI